MSGPAKLSSQSSKVVDKTRMQDHSEKARSCHAMTRFGQERGECRGVGKRRGKEGSEPCGGSMRS
eukprot:3498378-Rhodomonas_salina.3